MNNSNSKREAISHFPIPFTPKILFAFMFLFLFEGLHANTPDAALAADVNLILTVDNPEPLVGEQVTFTVKVTNEGPLYATNVEVIAIVMDGYENITGLAPGATISASGDTIFWNIPYMEVDEIVNFDFTVDVLAPNGTNNYDNLAEVFSMERYDRDSTPGNGADTDGDGDVGPLDDNPNDGSIDPDDEDDGDNEPTFPKFVDLELHKEVSNSTPDVGETISFTVEVSNQGTATATGVQITDDVPNGFSGISNISNAGSASGNVITWNNLTLNPGDTTLLSFDVVVEGPGAGVDYMNLAEVTDADQTDIDSNPDNGVDTDGDGEEDDDEDDEDDGDGEPVTPKTIDLSLIKTVDNPTPNIGEIVTFTITVSNDGTDDATGVAVLDEVPNGYGIITNISGGGMLTGSNIEWSDISIASGEEIVLTFDASVEAPSADTNYDNVAEITAADQYDDDSTPGNGADTDGDGDVGPLDDNPNDGSVDPDDEDDGDNEPVTPQLIDLQLVKTVNQSLANVGDIITFTINVYNEGPNEATNVNVVDLVPNGYANIQNVDNGGTVSGFQIDWTIPSIPATTAVELTFSAEVLAPTSTTSYINIAEITGADQYDTDSTPGNGADTDGDGDIGPIDNDGSEDPDDEDDGDDATIIVCVMEAIITGEPACVGECTDLIAEVSAGIAPFTYEWDNGLTGDDIVTVCQDVATTYSVTVTDAQGCTVTASIDLGFICTGDISVIGPGQDATYDCNDEIIWIEPTFDADCPSELEFVDTPSEGTCAGQGVTRTWTLTDFCGNTLSVSQTQDPRDLTPPTFDMVPEGSTFYCIDGPDFTDAVASDNCTDVTISHEDTDGLENCAGISIIRTFIATDACGNTARAEVAYTPIDDVAPVFSTTPEDGTYPCDQFDGTNVPDIFDEPTAADDCSEVILTFEDDFDPINCAGMNITRTWTATDACGNAATITQTMTAVDDTPPTFDNIPEDGTYPCGDSPSFDDLSATDNCSAVIVDFEDTIADGECAGEGTTRTWTATDACGNTATTSQTMIPNDDTAPTIENVGADGTYPCGTDPEFVVPTATDDCSDAILEFVEVPNDGSCAGPGITRIWTATDNCGNTATAQQVMTPEDIIAPEFVSVPENITYNCNEMAPSFGEPEATDNCSEITIEFTDTDGEANCAGTEIVRTWTATDACGNTSTASQTMTPIDDTPPVFTSVGEDGTFSCTDDPEFFEPTAEDDCGEVTITCFTDPGSRTCTQGVITKIWVATDMCGNSSTVSQTLESIDDEAPVIDGVGEDGTFECGQAPIFSTPTANDNCTEPILTFEDFDVDGDCAGPGVMRVWTATDECDNVSTASQVMTATDTTPPTITAGADSNYRCGEDPIFADPDASDLCSDVILDFEDDFDESNCAGTVITRTWIATDACGNSSTAAQTLTPVDDTPPTISGVGEDATYACGTDPIFSDASADDDCGIATLDFVDSDGEANCAGVATIRTWTATDGCGNTTTAQQILIPTDELAPTITEVGPNGTYVCGEDPLFIEPTAIDECSDISITFEDNSFNNGCQELGVTRTWTISDACGNESTASQTMLSTDNTPPTIVGVEADGTYDCNTDPTFSDPDAEDNCMSVTLSFEDTVSETNCAGNIITRLWTATDDCGNATTASQTMTPIDDTAPTITGVGDDGSMMCDGSAVFSEPEASDNCDNNPSLSFEDDMNDPDCNGTITRTWTATDACGNTSTASQTISILDEEAPVISGVGANGTYECGTDPTFSAPTVSDNCTIDVQLEYLDTTIPGDCAGDITIRTWTATDDCGNTSTATQQMEPVDSTPPVITGLGEDGTFPCGESPIFSEPMATDNCGDVKLSFVDDPASKNTCGQGVITRTWTACDECGNVSTATQTMESIDEVDPTISDVDPDGTYECGTDPIFSTPKANDECTSADITHEDFPFNDDDCDGGGITRVWTATDACGNTTSASQTMTAVDTQGPIFDSLTDGTYPCGTDPQFDDANATDLCGGASLSFEDIAADNPGCLDGGVTRVWTATDDCGNTSTAAQTMLEFDDVAPVFTKVPNDTTYQCGTSFTFCDDKLFSTLEIDFDACESYGPPTNGDYSEFTPTITTDDQGVTIEVIGGHLYRVDPMVNTHSCTPGVDGTPGMCVVSDLDCVYNPDNDKSVVLDLQLTPQAGHVAQFDALSFFENAPLEFTFINGGSGTNNYPLAYGIRIMKDGVTIFNEFDIPTTNEWSLESFDFSNNPDFEFSASTNFKIELLGYCEVGNDGTMSVWDLDELNLSVSSVNLAVPSCVCAVDDCSDVTITWEDADNDSGCAGIGITRTWIATDACGNSATAVQVVLPEDTTPPSINGVGDDDTFPCGESPIFSDPSATDECGNATITFEDNTDGFIVTRTWTATDDCGNTATASQSLTEIDCLTDIALNADVSNERPVLGQQVSISVDLSNQSAIDAHRIEVAVNLPSGLNFVNAFPSGGKFDQETGIWSIDLLKSKRTHSMVINAQVNGSGEYLTLIEVVDMLGTDEDSTPGNGVDTDGDNIYIDDQGDEDDGDAVLVTPTLANTVKMFPNPTVDYVNFEIFTATEEKIEIILYDQYGQNLGTIGKLEKSQIGFNQVEANVGMYVNGSYLTKIMIGNRKISKKLIIID